MYLAPCPFCGSKKVHVQYSLNKERKIIHCLDCDVEVCACYFLVNDERLAQMWNRRAEE